MTFCHILGTRILIIIVHNNFSSFRSRDNNLKFKDNSLKLRVNNFKFMALKLKSKVSRDNKLLA
jgi:hypothetical protein